MNRGLSILLAAALPAIITLMALHDVGTPVKPNDNPNYTGSLPVAVLVVTGGCAALAYIAGALSKGMEE